jgi:hypothetical protein
MDGWLAKGTATQIKVGGESETFFHKSELRK